METSEPREKLTPQSGFTNEGVAACPHRYKTISRRRAGSNRAGDFDPVLTHLESLGGVRQFAIVPEINRFLSAPVSLTCFSMWSGLSQVMAAWSCAQLAARA